MWIAQKYSFACLIVKLRNIHLWIGGSCWGGGIELELVVKTWAYKKNILLQVFLITYYKPLELNPHFPMPCRPMMKKWNTIWVARRTSAKLPQSTNPMLVYWMENKMPLIHHVVEQQECGCIIKDDEDLNERTQRHPMMKPMSKLMEVGWEQVRVLSWDDHKGLD